MQAAQALGVLMLGFVDRIEAVRATRAAFAGHVYTPGTVDCARMVEFHLRQLGHDVPALPAYDSVKRGLAAIRRRGFANMAAFLDEVLQPVQVARMLPGDVALLAGDEGGEAALVIKEGVMMIGFHEDSETLANIRVVEIARAWSVEAPCPK